jgi:hypothetical protein
LEEYIISTFSAIKQGSNRGFHPAEIIGQRTGNGVGVQLRFIPDLVDSQKCKIDIVESHDRMIALT